MTSVKVSSEFSPAIQVRVAEALDNPAPAPAEQSSAIAPEVPGEEDLINKNKIISLVKDHHNKIDKLTVTEERGGKKRVQFEVSPQGILRPNAQQTQQPAPQAAPPPAPVMPATASGQAMTKEAQASPMEMGTRVERGTGPGQMHSNPQAMAKAKNSLSEAVQYLRMVNPNHNAIGSVLRALNMLNAEGGEAQQVFTSPGSAMPQAMAKQQPSVTKTAKDDGWPSEVKEGRFTTWCKRNGFDGPSKACADKAFKSDDESVRGMASFYMNTVHAQNESGEVVEAKKKSKKKDWDPNPWAVCHTTVSKDKDPEKFERCVQDVKHKQASVEFPKDFLTAMGLGE